MNMHRMDMEGLYTLPSQLGEGICNVTTRKMRGASKSKMALPQSTLNLRDRECNGSLLIDSILSQDEEDEVVSMLNMANELNGEISLPPFYTSSQMGGTKPTRPSSPPLSPISFIDTCDQTTKSRHHNADTTPPPKSIGLSLGPKGVDYDNSTITLTPKSLFEALSKSQNRATFGGGGDDTNWRANVANSKTDVVSVTNRGRHDGECDLDDDNKLPHDVSDDQNKEGACVLGRDDGEVKDDSSVDGNTSQGKAGDDSSDTEKGTESGDEVTTEDNLLVPEYEDLKAVSVKLKMVDDLLSRLDDRSGSIAAAFKGLEASLQFSQGEIDDLKRENKSLRTKLGELETEDKRTQFQVQAMDDKVDRLDTVTKKRNLLFEGIPEQNGKKEDDKAISDLFDQLKVGRGINIEASYRVGPFNRSRDRPILVAFERQADRDLIYAKRMDLKHSANFQRVWINEDLGQASKRKRGLIRLIGREAQLQGIDCRTGKYALHINKVKYDASNWEDLPAPLHPTSLKQVQVDRDTVAYQSEHAPFSIFFPCKIIMGQHVFFCLEQAFQFLRAKRLNKPLAATRIYLSRDVRYIKQVGSELGTSEEWENQQFDLMYVLLVRKFQQHPEVKALLLKTGTMRLVEATPDRISSNALRRHEWPGRNRHGEILMTVRDYLKGLEKKDPN